MSGPHRETDENDQPRLDYYVEECQRLQRQYEAALEGKDAATARADTASAKLARAEALLREARAQLDYLDGKFQRTGTTAAVLARIDAHLSATDGAPAPDTGAAERAVVEALRDALERCVEVMDEQTDAVSSGGEEWDAVLEQARAALAAADASATPRVRGTNQGDHPKGGHDAPLGRGEGA